MATVAQSRLLELLARKIGFYHSGTATGGSTTTIEDTSADSFDARADRVTAGMWAHMLSANSAAPEDETRKVDTVATTTATLDTAYSTAPASGDTYEFLPYHTDDMVDAIREAVRTMPLDLLWLPLRNERITVGDRLVNGTFEAGATDVFTGWTKTAGTWTEESTIVFQGTRSAKGVASGADAQLTQAWQGDVAEITGLSVRFRLHMLALAANVARVGIDFGNSIAVVYSAYHTGNSSGTGLGQWESREATATIPAEAASITAIAEITDGSTAYFDWGGGLQVAKLNRYTLPTDFVNDPTAVLQQWHLDKPDGLYVPLNNGFGPIDGRLLRLEGKARLTVPTSQSSTVEIDESQAQLVILQAAQVLFTRLANIDGSSRDQLLGRAADYKREFDEETQKPGARMEPPLLYDNQGVVRYNADSAGRYFTLP